MAGFRDLLELTFVFLSHSPTTRSIGPDLRATPVNLPEEIAAIIHLPGLANASRYVPGLEVAGLGRPDTRSTPAMIPRITETKEV